MTKSQFKKWFPKALKERRDDFGLSQSQLADGTKLTPDWISHFESGRRLPDAYGFYKLQRRLGEFKG